MKRERFIHFFREELLPATLNSYSIVFFLNNKIFALGLMIVSFFNIYAGLSGLLAVLAAVLIAAGMGFDKDHLRKGFYSFNALLIGIGMGTFYDPGVVYFSLLLLAVLITLILSVTLGGWLGKKNLPHLSIPFVLGFWLILLPSSTFENLGLTQRNIYWINTAYAMGGSHLVNFLQAIDSLAIHKLADTYFRSLSSIVFQNNLLAGALIAILLLISSRIAFTLSVIGFLSASLFASFTGSDTTGFSYYNIGANYIMTALAIGGFFVIPSARSYLWTFLLVPLTSLVLLFMTRLFGVVQLPVFSMPFSVVVILFLYFLMMRRSSSGLEITPIQHFQPELNLYSYSNNKIRLSQLVYFPLHLPFWGEWIVSQGHDGKHTHKGEWSKAFDFMLLDHEMKSYTSTGSQCDDYHCFNKPVLAPADGVVEEITDQIDDNEIGKINLQNNWGNSITIRHQTGLYSQLSHLRKGSLKVAKGDSVKCGDILASCGNSGRSAQPHLHFQVQSSPKIGSKTLDYPFAYYLTFEAKNQRLNSFTHPLEGEVVSGLQVNNLLTKAFDFSPTTQLEFAYCDQAGKNQTVRWEAFTDAYNCHYLYCETSRSFAYFVNDGKMFYFTNFYGNKTSLLYCFYLTAFKVLLSFQPQLTITDVLPLQTIPGKNLLIRLYDFISPFSNGVRALFHLAQQGNDDPLYPQALMLTSSCESYLLGHYKPICKGNILLNSKGIEKFIFENKKFKIEAICINSY